MLIVGEPRLTLPQQARDSIEYNNRVSVRNSEQEQAILRTNLENMLVFTESAIAGTDECVDVFTDDPTYIPLHGINLLIQNIEGKSNFFPLETTINTKLIYY
jgi:hypothetical protein